MFKRKKERRIYLWTWQVVEDDRDRQREKKPRENAAEREPL